MYSEKPNKDASNKTNDDPSKKSITEQDLNFLNSVAKSKNLGEYTRFSALFIQRYGKDGKNQVFLGTAIGGFETMIKTLILEGVDINFNSNGMSALLLASHYGHKDLVKHLLSYTNILVNNPCPVFGTPLAAALCGQYDSKDKTEIITLLAEKDPTLLQVRSPILSGNPIELAVKFENNELLRLYREILRNDVQSKKGLRFMYHPTVEKKLVDAVLEKTKLGDDRFVSPKGSVSLKEFSEFYPETLEGTRESARSKKYVIVPKDYDSEEETLSDSLKKMNL